MREHRLIEALEGPLKPRYDWKDYLTRLLFIAAGGVAAVVFVQSGDAEMLPSLAIGGMLGAVMTATWRGHG